MNEPVLRKPLFDKRKIEEKMSTQCDDFVPKRSSTYRWPVLAYRKFLRVKR